MRRTASVGVVVAAAFVFSVTPWTGSAQGGDCSFNPSLGRIECSASGGTPGSSGNARPVRRGPVAPPDPIRYLHVDVDPVIGPCAYWSRVPGGIDTWDPINDPSDIPFFVGLPACPGRSEALTAAEIEAIAWSIFRSFPLVPPDPVFEPPEPGITGLPTYLSVTDPAPIVHSEALPDGRTLEVTANVTDLVVGWGDGASDRYPPEAAVPYPDGSATHTYTLKTCTASYRAEHPSGQLCHPSLEAYPVITLFTWSGQYSVGGSTSQLGTLDLVTEVAYDVDEVQGVLQP